MLVNDYQLARFQGLRGFRGFRGYGDTEALTAEQMRAEFRQTGNHLRGFIIKLRDMVWADPNVVDKTAVLIPTYNEAAIALQKIEQTTELEVLGGQRPYSDWFAEIHRICAILDDASTKLGYGLNVRKNIESWYSSRLISILSGAYTFTPEAVPQMPSEFLPLVVRTEDARPVLVEAPPPAFAPPVITTVPAAPIVGTRPEGLLVGIPLPAAEGRLPPSVGPTAPSIGPQATAPAPAPASGGGGAGMLIAAAAAALALLG